MSIPIDKCVPIPSWSKPTRLYPWNEMGVGDSFFIEGATEKDRNRVYGNARDWARRKNPTFKTTSRREKTGFRFWRIA